MANLKDNPSEGELAEFYERNRGNVAGLKPDRKLTARMRKSTIVSALTIQVSGSELAALQKAADKRELSLLDFIKTVAIDAAAEGRVTTPDA